MSNPIKKILSFFHETEGIGASDRLLLTFFKTLYIAMRVILRIVMGKNRRNKLLANKKLTFSLFINKVSEYLGLGQSTILTFRVNKYDCIVSVRLNKEDFYIITEHENEIIQKFTPNKSQVFVDVGAHIGLYSIIAAKRMGPEGRVVAVEAHPDNFRMLEHNVRLNKLTNILTLNYAAYDRETKVKLFVTDDTGYMGHHSLIHQVQEKFIEVGADRLDALLDSVGVREVNWIKIDVEGAELDVLRGAHDILSKSKDLTLLIEVHSSDLYKPVMDLLGSYNCKLEFETRYPNGAAHIIMHKV